MPGLCGIYEAEVKGEYPHLVQQEREVIMLFAELVDFEEDEGSRFCLFEVVLRGGVIWQGKDGVKAFFWSGDKIEEENVLFYAKHLKGKIRRVRYDQNGMLGIL